MELLSGHVRSSISRNREWQVTVLYTLQRCVALPIRDLNLGANQVYIPVHTSYGVRPGIRSSQSCSSATSNTHPLLHAPTLGPRRSHYSCRFQGGPRPRRQCWALPYTPTPVAATHHRLQYRGDLRLPQPTACSSSDKCLRTVPWGLKASTAYRLPPTDTSVYGKAHPLMNERWKHFWLLRPTPDLMVNTGITAQESLATFVV